MSTPLLAVQVQCKDFGARTVLRQIEFALQPGEIVCLVGASGCGKSTLLRIVAGLEGGFDGELRFDGRPVQGLQPEIGFVFQEPRLFPWLTVAQNVGFDVGPPAAGDTRVQQALIAEVGLAGREAALPKELSGGQAQRVALARGLYRRPRLLLLDEPFSAVDAFTRIKLQQLLTDVVARRGTTVLMVTHDLDEAVFLADRVLVLAERPAPLRDSVVVDLPRPRARDDAGLAQLRARLSRSLDTAQTA